MSDRKYKKKREREIVINRRWNIYRDSLSWVTVQKTKQKNEKTGEFYFTDKKNYHGNLRNAVKFILEVDPSMDGDPTITDIWSVIERQEILFNRILEVFSQNFDNFLKGDKKNDTDNA